MFRLLFYDYDVIAKGLNFVLRIPNKNASKQAFDALQSTLKPW